MKFLLKIVLSFAIISSTWACTDWFPDKSPYLAPKYTNTIVTEIKTSSVKISSEIESVGTGSLTEIGFCYNTSGDPSIDDSKVLVSNTATAGQQITTEITQLTPNTKYFIRPYAIDDHQKLYGTVVEFTTTSLMPPKVTIADATDIKFNTFSISGQITDLGTSDVTEYGHALSETNKEPTIADLITKMGSANSIPKDFKSVFNSLKANTTYYVRAYATNTTGTAYSEVKTVKTGALELAKVLTNDFSVITKTSVNVAGTISQQGTNSISDYGHVISKTNTSPTTVDNKTSFGVPSAIPKDFVSTFTSLEINTTYYTRAYAISEAGVAYGETKSFKTLDKQAPKVLTNEISNVTVSSGNVAGKVTEEGTSSITSFGHVISKTNQSPTINDTKTNLGATTTPKDYVSTFNQLEANTTYYTRAYAQSADGIGYGDVKSFKTLNALPPTVATISALAGSSTTGSASGQISSLGTSNVVNDYGFCYSSTNQNPTTNDTKKSLGSTSNPNAAFKEGFDKLTPNTTYYVRAYATNSVGTGYGNVLSFKTTQEIQVPPNFANILWGWGPLGGNSSQFCNSSYSEISANKKYTDPCSGYPPVNLEIWVSFDVITLGVTETITKSGVCAIPATQIGDPTIDNNLIEADFNKNNRQIFIYNNLKYTGITKDVYCTVAKKTAKEYYYENPLIPSDFSLIEYKFKVRAFVKTSTGKVYYSPTKTFIASSSCQVN